jgi:hypothetical protein
MGVIAPRCFISHPIPPKIGLTQARTADYGCVRAFSVLMESEPKL